MRRCIGLAGCFARGFALLGGAEETVNLPHLGSYPLPTRRTPILALPGMAFVLALAVNVAVVFPAVTNTPRGTVTLSLLQLSGFSILTWIPPEGAGDHRVTVPLDVHPGLTVPGWKATDLTSGRTLRAPHRKLT